MISLAPDKSAVVEADFGPLAYLSATRLKTWQECRLKWYFRYVEEIPVKPNPALFIGQLTHQVLQQWNLNRWRGLPADDTSLHPVFLELWQQSQPKGLNWEGKEAAHRDNTWNMLRHYLANAPMEVTEKPQAVEVMVERVSRCPWSSSAQRCHRPGATGRRDRGFQNLGPFTDSALIAHQHEVQLGCYALLYREATGQGKGGFELHHLVKTKEPKLVVTALAPMDRGQISRLVRTMESYVNGVKAEDWIPSPGQHCAWCDYFAQCRAWKG